MVVPVLMTSCQFCEYWNSGPDTPHKITAPAASMNAAGEPTAVDIDLAVFAKNSLMAAPPGLTQFRVDTRALAWAVRSAVGEGTLDV